MAHDTNTRLSIVESGLANVITEVDRVRTKMHDTNDFVQLESGKMIRLEEKFFTQKNAISALAESLNNITTEIKTGIRDIVTEISKLKETNNRWSGIKSIVAPVCYILASALMTGFISYILIIVKAK